MEEAIKTAYFEYLTVLCLDNRMMPAYFYVNQSIDDKILILIKLLKDKKVPFLYYGEFKEQKHFIDKEMKEEIFDKKLDNLYLSYLQNLLNNPFDFYINKDKSFTHNFNNFLAVVEKEPININRINFMSFGAFKSKHRHWTRFIKSYKTEYKYKILTFICQKLKENGISSGAYGDSVDETCLILFETLMRYNKEFIMYYLPNHLINGDKKMGTTIKPEPTIKDEVTWLRQTLFIQGIEIHDKLIEVMIESYKLVKEKGNKTTFKDALEVTKEINRRNKTTVKYELK